MFNPIEKDTKEHLVTEQNGQIKIFPRKSDIERIVKHFVEETKGAQPRQVSDRISDVYIGRFW